MCGIAGFLGGEFHHDAEGIIQRMSLGQAHRGPDHSGFWGDPDAGVALGHRRLAVLDLSPAGNQPMMSKSGRFLLVFNGEIYNHQKLRSDLERREDAHHWRGHSDTETLLAGFETWGIAQTVTRAVGMFAFAVWDRANRTLILARDRLGEKPLYYGWQDNAFVFASDLGALRAYPAFTAEVDREAIALLLRHNYIPAPRSIYRGVSKLIPGTIVTVPRASAREVQTASFWSLTSAVLGGSAERLRLRGPDVIDEVEQVLGDAVRQQMIADVPIGAFLSGGIDSSTIVALMQAQSSRRVKTFSVGFEEKAFNEAKEAGRVAHHLGTDHLELLVTHSDALAVIPRLPHIYQEPFADASQIPTFLIAQLARSHVTVALSGDGGDELFGGYTRHLESQRIWPSVSLLPVAVRSAIGRAIQAISPSAWDGITSTAACWTRVEARHVGDKLHKAAKILDSRSVDELYRQLMSQWDDVEKPAVLGAVATTPQLLGVAEELTATEQIMLADALGYLPDDVLTKVDRATMAVSLESRIPFLDHRVVEFAWKLPVSYKIRGGKSKWVLREVLCRYVPRDLVERPKTGFDVPLDSWLRGPLRSWAETLLTEDRLRREGFFEPAVIRTRWHEHLSGRRNWQKSLWSVLMFQQWLEEWA